MDSSSDDPLLRMMDEFERQREDPFDILSEYDRQMEMIIHPWRADDIL